MEVARGQSDEAGVGFSQGAKEAQGRMAVVATQLLVPGIPAPVEPMIRSLPQKMLFNAMMAAIAWLGLTRGSIIGFTLNPGSTRISKNQDAL